MKHLYRCLLYLFIALNLIGLGFFLLHGIGETVELLLGILGMANKEDAILPKLSQFPLFAMMLSFLVPILLCVWALYKEKVVMEAICFFVKSFVDAFRNLFVSLKPVEVVCVLILPFVASIYFALNIAVSYDEAFTYNYFTMKPFYYCMIFYPYPNNHVLHTLLTNVTDLIPFGSVLFKMRLSVIFISLFTWLIGYSFVKKYYTSRVALIVVGLASVCYMSIFYSFMSRGYAFVVLGFVVCLYAAYNIIYKGNRIRDWMFFVTAGVLGCYTIPSFLYAFATVNVLILIYNYKNIKYQFGANVIAGALVILAYAPIMVVDGMAALTSNQFVQHVSRVDIIEGVSAFYIAMYADIVGVPFWADWVILVPLVLTIWQKDKKHLVVWGVLMIAPIAIIFVHAVNPFYRTFLYYSFGLMFLMVVPFQQSLEKISKPIIIGSLLAIQIFAIYNFNTVVRIDEGFNTIAGEISEEFFKEGQTIVFPCIASANYEFEANIRGLNGKSIHFLNNEKANADTINNCDYVILEVARDQTVNKQPYYSSWHQNVYKNKK